MLQKEYAFLSATFLYLLFYDNLEASLFIVLLQSSFWDVFL